MGSSNTKSIGRASLPFASKSASERLARLLGVRLVLVTFLIAGFVGFAAAGVLSSLGFPLRAGIVTVGVSLCTFLFVAPFAYRFAHRLGQRLCRLGNSAEAISPFFGEATAKAGFAPTELPRIGQLPAMLDWLEDQINAFARGARSMAVERDRTRERLASQEATKANFFSKMSHELRTPLNAILGYSTLLHEEATNRGDKASQLDLERIQYAGHKLLSLLDDLLELSGLQGGQIVKERTVFQLSELVHEIAVRASRGAVNIEVRGQLDGHLMMGDRAKIGRCLRNLVDDAVENAVGGEVWIAVAEGSDQVRISVHDDGPAISPDAAISLFDPAMSRVAQGGRQSRSPVALTVARNLAQSLGGDCTVEPDVAHGATLTLQLPGNSSAPDASVNTDMEVFRDEPTSTADAADETRRTVLIIDDDPAAIDLLSRWLRRSNYHVLSANSGKSGLEQARRVRTDLILLDALMPHQTGYEVLIEIRSDPQLADIPVVLITVDDDRTRGLGAGANDFVRKPISEDQLRTVLSTYDKAAAGDILIVDDDAEASSVMRRDLERLGYQARRARDGAQGLALARQSRPCAIVLDLAMPGVDGFAFLATLGADIRLSDIPVIVVSGDDLSLSQHQVLMEANARYFRKGTTAPREIAETLRELIA